MAGLHFAHLGPFHTIRRVLTLGSRFTRHGRAGGRAGRAGKIRKNKTYKTSEWPKVTGTHGGLHSGLQPRAPTSISRSVIIPRLQCMLHLCGNDPTQIHTQTSALCKLPCHGFLKWENSKKVLLRLQCMLQV